MSFTKKDLFASLILGEVASWLVIAIIHNLNIKISLTRLLPVILPLVVLVGMYLAFWIGKWAGIIWQLAKFAASGVLNTLVDWGVLNLLIFITGIATGYYYSLFKAISFVIGATNSYVWNKFWTFEAGDSREAGKEFLQFFVVSLIGFGINVGIASLIVNYLHAPAGVSSKLWANAGAAAGSVAALIWNFLGYKLIVFKKKDA